MVGPGDIKKGISSRKAIPLYSIPVNEGSPAEVQMEYPRKLVYLGYKHEFEGFEGCHTVYDNFMHGYSNGANRKFVGRRRIKSDGGLGKYRWWTYKEGLNEIKNIGAGLIAYGIKPHEYLVGINRNCIQWILLYHAACFNSIPHVFIQDNNSPNDLLTRLKVVSDIPYLVLSVLAAEILLKSDGSCLKNIEKVIIFSDFNPGLVNSVVHEFKIRGIDSISFDELSKLGAMNPSPLNIPSENDVAMVLFTSGTTAEALGVKMTHKNLMCSVSTFKYYAAHTEHVKITKYDRLVSYLPMSHAIEIISQLTAIYFGSSLGFYSGDMDTFLKDVSLLRPTIFVSVPRFYNIIYREVSIAIAKKKSISAMLFKKAYVSALNSTKQNSLWYYFIRKIAFNKVKSILGGRVNLFISGSSSIEPNILKFFSVCFSCPFIETYGLTEASGLLTMSLGIPETEGTVGPPGCSCIIKITNVQPLRTYLESGIHIRGEICVKGDSICSMYYNKTSEGDPIQTDEDGWLHTRDIGYWTNDGLLKIVDRKVNIIPLKGGTIINSENIEDAFNVCLLVEAYICFAKPGGPYAVGVAFLSNEALKYAYMNNPKLKFDTLDEAIESRSFRFFVKAELDSFISKSGLVPSLVCKHIYFESKDIRSLEIFTHSYKIKRHIVYNLYKNVFDKFLGEGKYSKRSFSENTIIDTDSTSH